MIDPDTGHATGYPRKATGHPYAILMREDLARAGRTVTVERLGTARHAAYADHRGELAIVERRDGLMVKVVVAESQLSADRPIDVAAQAYADAFSDRYVPFVETPAEVAQTGIPTGPIEEEPLGAIVAQLGGSMPGSCWNTLAVALDGIELGAHDRKILQWLCGWEPSTVATIASLIVRARAAGQLAGELTAQREIMAAEYIAALPDETSDCGCGRGAGCEG